MGADALLEHPILVEAVLSGQTVSFWMGLDPLGRLIAGLRDGTRATEIQEQQDVRVFYKDGVRIKVVATVQPLHQTDPTTKKPVLSHMLFTVRAKEG